MAPYSRYQTQRRTITAGCTNSICGPWEYPEGSCNDVCTSEADIQLFKDWWDAVSEWLFHETCQQFPGVCPAETEPCPPCGCACSDYCGCGPWASIDLSGAFCHEVARDETGRPCLEFVFPQGIDDGLKIVGPDSGYWELLPDLLTVDWCKPFTNQCGGMWPEQDHCNSAWSVRAMIGKAPPKLLLQGGTKFVCEIVKDLKGLDNCLPDGVRSVTRRNITVDIGPQFEETINFDTQGTGIPSLDFALRRWGCDQVPVRASYDPMDGLRQERREVWTWRGKLNPTPPSICQTPSGIC